MKRKNELLCECALTCKTSRSLLGNSASLRSRKRYALFMRNFALKIKYHK